MTGASQAVSGTFQRAKAWVRYSGGTVRCYLKGNDNNWNKLTNSTNRATVNSEGISCLENEFTLNTAISGSVQAKLELSVSSGSQMKVYDYGVVFF